MAKPVVRYPWDKWFTEYDEFELIQGEDFDGMPHSMAQQIRNKADRYNCSVSIAINEVGTLYVVITEKEE